MGPKGVGFLLCREEISKNITPLQNGGGQELGLRSGTQPVSLIAGMALAIDLLNEENHEQKFRMSTEYSKISKLTRDLRNQLEDINGLIFTGHPT